MPTLSSFVAPEVVTKTTSDVTNDDKVDIMSSSCRIFQIGIETSVLMHEDVIEWKHFPRYWSFVRGIHRSPVNSLHTGQWRGALMFSLICARINGWVNNREAGDLRRHRAHYDVIVMDESQIWSLLLGSWQWKHRPGIQWRLDSVFVINKIALG